MTNQIEQDTKLKSDVPPTGGTPKEASSKKKARPSAWDIYLPPASPEHVSVIYLASFPQIIFFWPTILTLLFSAVLQGIFGVSPVTVGWIAVLVSAFNFIVLVQDFDQKQFLIFVLGIIVLLMGGWIAQVYGIPLLSTFGGWFFSFQPQFSTDSYLLLGFLLAFQFIWGMITPLFSYWNIEANEFVHFTQPIGRDMSIARLGCTVYKDVPDVFEGLLTFGGGTLLIRRQEQVLAEIKNVPFLGRRMRAIEHILSETRVTIEQESR